MSDDEEVFPCPLKAVPKGLIPAVVTKKRSTALASSDNEEQHIFRTKKTSIPDVAVKKAFPETSPAARKKAPPKTSSATQKKVSTTPCKKANKYRTSTSPPEEVVPLFDSSSPESRYTQHRPNPPNADPDQFSVPIGKHSLMFARDIG